jgi:hypothetical protein
MKQDFYPKNEGNNTKKSLIVSSSHLASEKNYLSMRASGGKSRDWSLEISTRGSR